MKKKFDSEYREESAHLGDLGVDWRIILRWILGKQGVRMLTGFIWLSLGSIGGLL
jgi:hypothetical protein